MLEVFSRPRRGRCLDLIIRIIGNFRELEKIEYSCCLIYTAMFASEGIVFEYVRKYRIFLTSIFSPIRKANICSKPSAILQHSTYISIARILLITRFLSSSLSICSNSSGSPFLRYRSSFGSDFVHYAKKVIMQSN